MTRTKIISIVLYGCRYTTYSGAYYRMETEIFRIEGLKRALRTGLLTDRQRTNLSRMLAEYEAKIIIELPKFQNIKVLPLQNHINSSEDFNGFM